MRRVLKAIRIVLFILGITVSLLTSVMSYDASRIGLDAAQAAQSIRVVEEGDVTTATLNLRIQNNGYLFSLKDADLVITVTDGDQGEPLGTGGETFTIDPSGESSKQIRIPMSTQDYRSAAKINVTVAINGGLALNLPQSRITFVTFTLTASEEVRR